MAGVKIGPVDDKFVVEDAVAKLANERQTAIHGTNVTLGFWSAMKGTGGYPNRIPVLGGALIKERSPKSECQLRDNSPWCEAFILPL